MRNGCHAAVAPVAPTAGTRRLRRRYLSLGLGELAAAAMFLFAAALLVADAPHVPEAMLLWCALAPLVFVLVQAGFYWLLALRWTPGSMMPAGIARVFAMLRTINQWVLLLALVCICICIGAWRTNASYTFGYLALWLFAVIEYVNYFHRRLAYPATEWLARVAEWRRPRLARDVELSLARGRDA